MPSLSSQRSSCRRQAINWLFRIRINKVRMTYTHELRRRTRACIASVVLAYSRDLLTHEAHDCRLTAVQIECFLAANCHRMIREELDIDANTHVLYPALRQNGIVMSGLNHAYRASRLRRKAIFHLLQERIVFPVPNEIRPK